MSQDEVDGFELDVYTGKGARDDHGHPGPGRKAMIALADAEALRESGAIETQSSTAAKKEEKQPVKPTASFAGIHVHRGIRDGG
ncbi:hypothetical protein [Streptomyces virginiae]|uniref:hypothetical protein n=1 Tax=Streptomyces virginiae TaxID=1961 RepID=UPI002F90D3F7